jgi:hypothetical protein
MYSSSFTCPMDSFESATHVLGTSLCGVYHRHTADAGIFDDPSHVLSEKYFNDDGCCDVSDSDDYDPVKNKLR